MSEMLELSMSSGQTTKILAEATVGVFSIHRAVGAVVDGWTVTHTASGKKIWTTQMLPGAIRVAQYLDQAQIIPEGKEEAESWRQALSGPDHARLVEQLSEIAPRIVA